MRRAISILCVLLLWQIGFCQNGKALKIRKLKYDTTFYTQNFIDTATSSAEINISPLASSFLVNGTWYENVLFTSDSLFVFTKIMSKRQKRLAVDKPKKFWQIIERKRRKRKLSYYTTWYNFNQLDTKYDVKITTKTFCRVTERGTKKVAFDKKIAFDSAEASTSQTLTDYTYLSGYDSVFLDRKIFNINTICRNQGDYSACFHVTLFLCCNWLF
jgi:hypothetical protein